MQEVETRHGRYKSMQGPMQEIRAPSPTTTLDLASSSTGPSAFRGLCLCSRREYDALDAAMPYTTNLCACLSCSRKEKMSASGSCEIGYQPDAGGCSIWRSRPVMILRQKVRSDRASSMQVSVVTDSQASLIVGLESATAVPSQIMSKGFE